MLNYFFGLIGCGFQFFLWPQGVPYIESIKFFRNHGKQGARHFLFWSHQIRLPEQYKTQIILSIELIYFAKFDETAIERFKW
jgi:hypothetical protein